MSNLSGHAGAVYFLLPVLVHQEFNFALEGSEENMVSRHNFIFDDQVSNRVFHCFSQLILIEKGAGYRAE